MASVTQVRSIIDSKIGSLLGTYNLPNNTQIHALWVRGSQQIPKDWTVNGIECVIDEVPETRSSPTLSKAVFLNELWTVTLTSFDTATTLESPRLLLLRVFPDITNVVYTPQTDITFETLKVQIPDYSIFSEIS